MYNHLLANKYLSINDVSLPPREGVVDSRSEIEIEPFIYSAPMDKVTGYDLAKVMLEDKQMPVISRFIPEKEIEQCLIDFGHEENIFFAVGFDDYARFVAMLNKLISAKSITKEIKVNVALDIAHGDMKKAHRFTDTLSQLPHIRYIMSGSICTGPGARRAYEAGCTHIRVGVGPGAVCTTRLMTGIGVPQLSAVYAVATELADTDAHIIADGGIKHPGDAVKYLCAGATGVMLGSVLSKVRESAGWTKIQTASGSSDTRLKKEYRGQASASFQHSIYGQVNHCPEGVSTPSFYWDDDPAYWTWTYGLFTGGLRSAISYLGKTSSKELNPDEIEFIEITSSAYREGTPHYGT